jgi:hypothetical protein
VRRLPPGGVKAHGPHPPRRPPPPVPARGEGYPGRGKNPPACEVLRPYWDCAGQCSKRTSACRSSARSGFGFARGGRLHRGEQECNSEVVRYPRRRWLFWNATRRLRIRNCPRGTTKLSGRLTRKGPLNHEESPVAWPVVRWHDRGRGPIFVAPGKKLSRPVTTFQDRTVSRCQGESDPWRRHRGGRVEAALR